MLQEGLLVLPRGVAAADTHLRHRLVLHCALKSPSITASGAASPLSLCCCPHMTSLPTATTGVAMPSLHAGLAPLHFKASVCSSFQQHSGFPSRNSSGGTVEAHSSIGSMEASVCYTDALLHCGVPPLPRIFQAEAPIISYATSLDDILLIRTINGASSCERPRDIFWSEDVGHSAAAKPLQEEEKHEVGEALPPINQSITVPCRAGGWGPGAARRLPCLVVPGLTLHFLYELLNRPSAPM